MSSVPHDLVLTGARVLLPDGRLEHVAVEVSDGRVVGVQDPWTELAPALETIDLRGRIVSPGMIDTHVHGRLGHHVMAATRGAVDTIGRALRASGTTSFVGATATVEYEQLMRSVADLARLVGPVPGGAELLGIHLEGPFLSPARRGVHASAHLVPPTDERLDLLLDAARGSLRICTLAPELDEECSATRRLVDAGVQVSIGHTDADFSCTVDAIDRGASRATHLFNGMAPIHHRAPGPVPALLADPRVFIELIADGVHVAPALVAVLLTAARPEGPDPARVDGTDVAGLPEGAQRRWEGTPVVIRDGRSETPDGGVAGGTSTVLDGVRVAVRAGVPLEVALAAGSTVPADSLGLTDRGRIEVGLWADLVVLTEALDIEMTVVHGVVHQERND